MKKSENWRVSFAFSSLLLLLLLLLLYVSVL